MWGFGSSSRIGETHPLEPKPRLIQDGSISLLGVQLETQVAIKVLDDMAWELSNMQRLLTYLQASGYYVKLCNMGSRGWACQIHTEQINDESDCVQEYANESPAIALARAALAAVREWPR